MKSLRGMNVRFISNNVSSFLCLEQKTHVGRRVEKMEKAEKSQTTKSLGYTVNQPWSINEVF